MGPDCEVVWGGSSLIQEDIWKEEIRTVHAVTGACCKPSRKRGCLRVGASYPSQKVNSYMPGKYLYFWQYFCGSTRLHMLKWSVFTLKGNSFTCLFWIRHTVALSDRGCEHTVTMCDSRRRGMTFGSLGFQPVFLYSLDWIQGAFPSPGTCASYESGADMGHIECCLSSHFFICVMWQLALTQPVSRHASILRKGIELLKGYSWTYSPLNVMWPESQTYYRMHVYLSPGRVRRHASLVPTHLFVLPLRAAVFLKSGVLLTLRLPEHSFPYSPSLCTEWGLTENRRRTCWHLKQMACW